MSDNDKLEVNPPNSSESPRETVRPRPPAEEPARPRSSSPENATTGSRPGQPSSGGGGKPVVLAVLYIASVAVGITGLVAFILALVWKSEPHEDWETSHYDYHIRTFLLWLGATVAATFLILTIIGALIGIPLAIAAVIWVLVRGIVSLIRASNREPMPNPTTWLV